MGKMTSQLQDLPLAQQRFACPREASSGHIIARHYWHSVSYPLCQTLEHWPHQILKGGRKLLCAKLADPAPAPATHGGGPAAGATPGPSAGHGPRRGARGCGLAPAGAPGRSVGHGPRRGARGCDPTPTSAPGRSAEHEPPPAARGGRPVAFPGPGRSIGQIDAF